MTDTHICRNCGQTMTEEESKNKTGCPFCYSSKHIMKRTPEDIKVLGEIHHDKKEEMIMANKKSAKTQKVSTKKADPKVSTHKKGETQNCHTCGNPFKVQKDGDELCGSCQIVKEKSYIKKGKNGAVNIKESIAAGLKAAKPEMDAIAEKGVAKAKKTLDDKLEKTVVGKSIIITKKDGTKSAISNPTSAPSQTAKKGSKKAGKVVSPTATEKIHVTNAIGQHVVKFDEKGIAHHVGAEKGAKMLEDAIDRTKPDVTVKEKAVEGEDKSKEKKLPDTARRGTKAPEKVCTCMCYGCKHNKFKCPTKKGEDGSRVMKCDPKDPCEAPPCEASVKTKNKACSERAKELKADGYSVK